MNGEELGWFFLKFKKCAKEALPFLFYFSMNTSLICAHHHIRTRNDIIMKFYFCKNGYVPTNENHIFEMKVKVNRFFLYEYYTLLY